MRRVTVLAFPGAELLDMTGPLEVFAEAADALRKRGRANRGYEMEIVAERRGPVRTTPGVRLVADRAIGEVRDGTDTLLVPGGPGVWSACERRPIVDWIRRMRPRVRRLASVCTGTFVVAAAGLFDGQRATTHWRLCPELARRFPKVRLEPDRIFVRAGSLYSSAGVSAGMDLALALVEEDHGRELALEVAREMVLFVHRPGGQSQFSAQLQSQLADREPLRELQAFISDHPDADHSVARLAARVGMSPRNFARVFAQSIGTTPARFVERARVEAARRRLEQSKDGVVQVAAKCGFGTSESMRRAFLRQIKVAPTDYRSRFRVAR